MLDHSVLVVHSECDPSPLSYDPLPPLRTALVALPYNGNVLLRSSQGCPGSLYTEVDNKEL
jgi:hypothetical protein